MPRAKKPTEQLKLEGTYRADRHAKNADKKIAEITNLPESVQTPASLTDPYVKDFFEHHAKFLCRMKILALSDVPELETMSLVLQQARKVKILLDKYEKEEDHESAAFFEKRWLRLVERFSVLATKYFISPGARAKLTLDNLNVEKTKKELEKAGSIESLILAKKR